MAPLNKVKRSLSSLCLYYFSGCCTYVQGLLLTSEKRKGWRWWHSFLWGLYPKGEHINFHQNPNMCKLVTWPCLDTSRLEKISLYILFWISICRVNIFITMGIEEYGYLDTASVCHQRSEWHPTPVLLPGKSHGQRGLVGCSPWGR